MAQPSLHRRLLPPCATLFYLLLTLPSPAHSHEHNTTHLPEGKAISDDPIDTILWIHIAIQILTFGIIFPTGMVLGIVRSRFHVPLQILGTLLSILGYILGHLHRGRQFRSNIHSSTAPKLMSLLALQILLGIYLKLHLTRGLHSRIRPWIVLFHGILGKAFPVISWIQILFGGITSLGFCRKDHTGQCIAHFIMGSAFIGYGILLTIILVTGQLWIRRTGRSQEFYDSSVIALWGVINTFTEHRWGQKWGGNDIQHTTMGILWWAAGLVGVWLSRPTRHGGPPKRNVIPGLVILLTGWAMSSHKQHLKLSSMVHSIFGYTLMAAGLARIVEISLVLRDKPDLSVQRGEDTDGDGNGNDGEKWEWRVNSWQFLPPFLLYASGFLFMGATEEQMLLISNAGVTHVSYVLVLYSCAFVMFLFVNILLHIYHINSRPTSSSRGLPLHQNHRSRTPLHREDESHESDEEGDEQTRKKKTKNGTERGKLNGHLNGGKLGKGRKGKGKGNARRKMNGDEDEDEDEENEGFELEGLISGEDLSEDDDGEQGRLLVHSGVHSGGGGGGGGAPSGR